MPRKMRKLLTVTLTVGVIGGLAFGTPSASADPEVDPAIPGPVAPIDPAAAQEPVPPPVPGPAEVQPPADPLAVPPPAGPLAPPPPANPFAPPTDPLAAAQPTTIPEGTPA